jgi:4a-hydroxytetrahydrobiopterin dehydratase
MNNELKPIEQLPSELQLWKFSQTTVPSGECQSQIYRLYQFDNFANAIAFIQQASKELIAPQDHHPRWQNTYSTVEIWLTTHQAKNRVTERDICLAKGLETLWIEGYHSPKGPK